jgi:hypothetical protein
VASRTATTLLKEFDKGSKTQEKPWCAMALGVYSFYKYEAQKAAKDSVEPETPDRPDPV